MPHFTPTLINGNDDNDIVDYYYSCFAVNIIRSDDMNWCILHRLSGSGYEEQLSFLRGWLNDHIQDAQNTLHKPLLLAEFGISTKNFGSNSNLRDRFFDTVYSAIYSSASGGGAAAGGLFWQLLAQGMDSFRDGYEIIVGESPSTDTLIAQQSQKLIRIRKMYVRLRNIEKLKKARDIRSADGRN